MKFACLAAVLAVTTAAALPAAAADPTVRISVVGKTDTQVAGEIRAAATTVCGAAFDDCAVTAVRDAQRQYAAIKRGHNATIARVEVVRGERAQVRVAVAGRSVAQVDGDIDRAAHAVCRALDAAGDQACVARAVKDAHVQLRELAAAARPERVASR